jgi:hypothetical protein
MQDKFNTINNLKPEEFRRLTGVKKETFAKMLELLAEANKIKKQRGGKPNKLSLENQLLLFLEYYREYRTFFHIGKSFGVSEATAFRITNYVEIVLLSYFKLPNRKEMLNNLDDILLIDVTEVEIERPKKSKEIIIQARKRGIH